MIIEDEAEEDLKSFAMSSENVLFSVSSSGIGCRSFHNEMDFKVAGVCTPKNLAISATALRRSATQHKGDIVR